MTEDLVNRYSLIAGAISLRCSYDARQFLDEGVMTHSVELLNYLWDHSYLIAFVTMPISDYHKGLCVFEKQCQIQRVFGVSKKSLIIFDEKKYLYPGKVLVDDSVKIVSMQQKAVWKAVFMDQVYNQGVDCPRIFNREGIVEDFLKVLEKM